MKRTLTILATLGLLVAPVAGQEKPGLTKPSATDRTVKRDQPEPISNVRIDITITDSSVTPPTKTLTLVSASDWRAQIRNEGVFNFPMLGNQGTGLNVDVTPTLQDGNRVRLDLTVWYTPPTPEQSKGSRVTLNQSLRAILENGKPLVVSQSADPTGDRKVTLEVKATILK